MEYDPFSVLVKETLTLAAFAFQQNCSISQLRELNQAALCGPPLIGDTDDLDAGTWLRIPQRLYLAGPTTGNASEPPMGTISSFLERAKRYTAVEEVLGTGGEGSNQSKVRLYPSRVADEGDLDSAAAMQQEVGSPTSPRAGGARRAGRGAKLMPHTRRVVLPKQEFTDAVEQVARCHKNLENDRSVTEFAETEVTAAWAKVNKGFDESPLKCVNSRHPFPAESMLCPVTSTLCWYPEGARGSSNAPHFITKNTGPEEGENEDTAAPTAGGGGGGGATNEKAKMLHPKSIKASTAVRTFFRPKAGCIIFKPNPIDLLRRPNQVKPWALLETTVYVEEQHRQIQQQAEESRQHQKRIIGNGRSTHTAAGGGGDASTPPQQPLVGENDPRPRVAHDMESVAPPRSLEHPNLGDTFVVEIVVLDKAGGHTREVWQFLPDAPLSQLGDVISCGTARLPYPFTRNNFFWLGGSFYVDDRDTNSDDGDHNAFRDLTRTIRDWNPFGAHGKNSEEPEPFPSPKTDHGEVPGHHFRGHPKDFAFSTSPVKSQSRNTFADLTNVTLGECGVFRHYGGCDHYFYVHSVHRVAVPVHLSVLPEELNPDDEEEDSMPTQAGASSGAATGVGGGGKRSKKSVGVAPDTRAVIRYPYMIQGLGEKVLLCQGCKLLPSTILAYNDRLCPRNPTPFCKKCYEALRPSQPPPASAEEDDSPADALEDRMDGSVCVELPPACYFSSKN